MQQAYYVTGDSDFVLIVTAADVPAYERLMARLLSEHPAVTRYTTSVVLSPVKRGLHVPVQAWGIPD